MKKTMKQYKECMLESVPGPFKEKKCCGGNSKYSIVGNKKYKKKKHFAADMKSSLLKLLQKLTS